MEQDIEHSALASAQEWTIEQLATFLHISSRIHNPSPILSTVGADRYAK
jgi:hypothetical protein